MRTLTNVRFFCIISIIIFLTQACSDATPTERVPNQPPPAGADVKTSTCLNLVVAPKSWAGGISTLFQSNCGSCHPGSMPTNYTMYYDVTTSISTVMMRIDAGTMPPRGALAAADQAAIHAWIAAGMPEVDGVTPVPASAGTGASGASGASGACPSTTAATPPATTPASPPATPPAPPIAIAPLEPTYAKGIKQIMSAYCVGCHSASGGTGPYFDTYNDVVANYSMIRAEIVGGSMPVPRTATSKLPADKIDIVTKWGSNPNAPYGRFAP